MKLNLKHVSKDVSRFIAEQSPQILTVLGAVGVGATAYLTHKAALKAREEIFNTNVLRGELDGDRAVYLTKREEIEKVWKLYIPAVATGVMTVACIVAANRVQARRFAALAAAYGVLSGDFDEFREKAAEKLGLKKADELNKELSEGKVVGALPVGAVLPDGKTWFCDMSSGRIFPSTLETIKAGVNKINYACNNQRDMSLNDFYEAIGLEGTTIGDILAWDSSHQCDITPYPILTDTHGAVTAFRFVKNPRPN